MPRKTIPQASDLITHTSAPLTVEDVRKIPGYENCPEETAQKLLLQIEQFADFLLNLNLYGKQQKS